MTKEQEEAIEKLEHVNRYYDCNNYYSRYELDCIETVLNMIKEKDKKTKRLKKENANLKMLLIDVASENNHLLKVIKKLKKYGGTED